MRFHLYLFHVFWSIKVRRLDFQNATSVLAFVLFLWSRTIVVVAVRLNVIHARRDKTKSLASEHIYFPSKSIIFWRTKFVCFFCCNCANMPFPPKLPSPSLRHGFVRSLCEYFIEAFFFPLPLGPETRKVGTTFPPWPPFPIDFSVVGVFFLIIFRGNMRARVYANCVFYHMGHETKVPVLLPCCKQL